MQNSKADRYQRETQQCYREMLTVVHALGAYKVEGTIPGTSEHVVLNGNAGVAPEQPSPVWSFKTVSDDAEAIARKVQQMFLGGRQAAPVTITWQPDTLPITI